MEYFKDLIIGGVMALRFRRHWYLGRHVYALMLTEQEFGKLQQAMDEILTYEHRRDH